MLKNKHLTEEHKKKIGLSNKGKIMSINARKKISLARKGKVGNNKGKHWKIKDTSKMKGRIISKETRIKIGLANLGRRNTEETKQKMREIALRNHNKPPSEKGEKSHMWVGDRVGYTGLHQRLYKVLGKPSFCEACGTEDAKKFEWANISGKYKYDFEDWIRLCDSCHRRFDKGDFCKNGHRFTKENTLITKEGWRACKMCQKIRNQQRYF